eukprot:13170255-Alexandrium_andersonii.AAC.1
MSSTQHSVVDCGRRVTLAPPGAPGPSGRCGGGSRGPRCHHTSGVCGSRPRGPHCASAWPGGGRP